MRARSWPLFAACSALLTLLCYHRVPSYGFTDMDTLLLVRASRVESAEDFVGLFGQKLTGGRARVGANFYRPAVALTYAGLRAVFGWDARGYHVFDLALHALNGFLLALLASALARRTGAGPPRAYGLVCLAIFVAHPLGVEVVPAIARNGDLLVCAFSLAALLALDGFEATPSRGWRTGRYRARLLLVTALFGAALASKEPGIVLLGALFCYAVVCRSEWSVARRVARAMLLLLPCLLVTGLYFAVRVRALGDPLGGYPSAGWSAGFTALFVANQIWIDLLVPGYAFALSRVVPPIYAGAREAWPLWLALLALAGATALALARRARRLRRELAAWGAPVPSRAGACWRVARDALARPRARIALFAGLVMLQYGALFAVTGIYERRLLYAFTAYFALAAGLLPIAAAGWARELLARRLPARAAVVRAGGLAAVAALVLVQPPQSPLFHRYDEWRQTGEAARLLTEALREAWSRLPDGSRVLVANMPGSFALDPMRWVLYSPLSTSNALPPKAVSAWLEDRFPRRSYQVGALALYRYREPLEGFRHRARLRRGWLAFDVPRADLDSSPLEELDDFRVVELGARRVALAWRHRRPPRDTWLLVFDGARPRFFPVSRLRGGPLPPAWRPRPSPAP